VRLAAAALLVAVLAGCGSSGTAKRRDAVNAYFDKVDAAQAPLISAKGQIDQAFRAFRIGANSPKEVRELQFAQARVGEALRRVRAVDPPDDAKKIHADLVRLLTRERAVAHELYWTTTYQPQFARAVAGLSPAGKALNAELKAAGGGKKVTAKVVFAGYATAFSHYADALDQVSAKLAKLDPPPLFEPTLKEQEAAIARSVRLSRTIASDLAAKNVKGANHAIRELFVNSAALSTTASRKSAVEAVRDYTARLRGMAVLAARVARERQQLQAQLG
jgi:hypothetical protein